MDESTMNNIIKVNDSNRIYFLCGNARTVLSCFDSMYKQPIKMEKQYTY